MGETIGDYEIIRELTRGRRSILHTARSRFDGAEVLLKEFTIPAEAPEEFRKDYVERYREECKWLLATSHPNIVKAIEVINPTAEHPAPVLVLEKLEHSLQDILAANRKLDLQEVVGWMVQVLMGIQAFHDQGIVHRGIKPSHLMFDSYGCPKIIDLCMSVEVGEEITLSLDEVPTQYAAAELYRGRAGANFSIDVYSVGFMFYQLLCGEERFKTEFRAIMGQPNEGQYWMNWHNDPHSSLRPLNEVNPEIPEYLSSILLKMAAKNLPDRYQTVSAVLDDLAVGCQGKKDPFSLKIGEYVPAAAPPPEEAGFKLGKLPIPQKKLMMIAVSAVFSLILLGGIGAYLMQQAYNKKVLEHLTALYKETLAAYKASDYPMTRDQAMEGQDYLKEVRREEQYKASMQFFQLISGDATWIEGLEADLKAATDALAAGRLDEAKAKTAGLLDQKYERGSRNNDLHEATGAKFDDLQKRARALMEQIAARIEKKVKSDSAVSSISQSIKQGKFRQAYYLLLTAQVEPEQAAPLLQKVEPVVKALDEGRALFDQKKFVDARAAFDTANGLAEGQSLESAYFMQQIDIWPLGSLNPVDQLAASKAEILKDSIEQRLLELTAQLTGLFIRKYDLATEGLDEAIQALRGSGDALLGDMMKRVKEQVDANSPFLKPQPLDQLRYPIEDSERYFINLQTDFRCLRFRLELEEKNVDAARDLLEKSKDQLQDLDRRYYEARLQEDKALGGAPDQAVGQYLAILKESPLWAECGFRLAMMTYAEAAEFFRGGQLAEAGAAAEKALGVVRHVMEVLPQNERFRWWGARVADLGASIKFAGKDYEGARGLYAVAAECWPDFPCAWYGMGISYLKERKKDEARECFGKFEAAYQNRRCAFADEDQNMQQFQETIKKFLEK